MTKTKILKIKVGEVYVDGKSYPVFQQAWKKTSKDGKTNYYEIRSPIFIQEVETKTIPEENIEAGDV